MADVKKVITIEIDAETGEVKQLNKELDNTSKKTKDANKAAGQLTSSLDKMTGGAITAFKGLVSGAKSAVAALTTVRRAVMATGIGLLVVAVSSLLAFFNKTERGAQSLRVIMAALGAVVGTLTDVVISLGESLFNAVSNPKEALKDLGDSISYYFNEFIPNAINKVLSGFGSLASAVKKLVKGDFNGALESAKKGVIELGDGVTDLNPGTAIFKSLANGAIELGKEINNDVQAAIELEKKLNDLKVAERQLTIQRAETNKEIAKARLLAEDETVSAEERLKALKEAVSLEQAQADRELVQEQARLKIMKEQADLSESNEETLDNIAQQEAKVLDLQTNSLRLQKRLATEVVSLEKEILSTKEQQAKEAKEANDARIKQIKDLKKSFEFEDEAFNFDDITKEIDAEVAKQEAIRQANQETEDFLAELYEKRFQEQQQADIDEMAREEAKAAAKKALAMESASLATDLLVEFASLTDSESKRGFAIQKAASLAQATTSTILSSIEAFKTASASPITAVNPAYPFIQAAAAAAFGGVRIAKIASTQYKGGGGGASAGGGRGDGAGSPNIQFNTVGASGINQLNESIVAQNTAVKAYVVSSEVSSAQSLDRNRQSNATFG